MKYVFWLAVIVAIVALGPLLVIWSLNTLFPALSIQYGISEWCAVVILTSAIHGTASIEKK